jgi:predicted AlkP superfamily pyrophosphatase or phosphodiesterase
MIDVGTGRRVRAVCLITLLAAPLAAAQTRSTAPRGAEALPVPKLAVIVSVDGLSWDQLSRYRGWYVSGLKRLLDESHVFVKARYRHINTETGPGHASLATGAPPRVTGIVANRWFETAGGKLRSLICTEQKDPQNPAGVVLGPGNLRVPTLGDRLAEAHSASRTVSVSAKDRSAIFLAGRHRRHAAFWYEQESGRFITSPVYEPPEAAKAVVAAFNKASAGAMLPGRFGLAWKKLPEPSPAPQPAPAPMLPMLDYQLPNNGIGWDHSLTVHPSGYFVGLYYSAFTDDLVAELALALLADKALALGRGDAPDVLAVSFSAHDLVAHSYGAESEEALDTLRRLDRHVGRLLEALERGHGKERVAVAFSADHGFPPIPEAEKQRNPDFTGGRLVYGSRTMPNFLERLNRGLSEELCLPAGSRPLYGSDGWNLAYNRPALPLQSAAGACGPAGRSVTAADIDRALPVVAMRFYKEELAGVFLVSRRESWPANDPATEFVKNDFDAERSGDAVLVPRRGVMMHWDPGRGAMHGTHHDYDTHVPLLFWGGAFRKQLSETPATPYDLAPTLAQLLRVTLDDASGRSRLGESP